jgi:16S rRNA (cytosine967-C5)-methyltransferase
MELLEALWPLVKLGGKLLYVVCSVFEAEGKSQIDAFLSRHSGCGIGKPSGGIPGRFALLPQQDDTRAGFPLVHDGFYYALLVKER